MARLPIPSPAVFFGLGGALQLWLWSRAWIYWDQILLLRLGMGLALEGKLAVFAKVMSGGGLLPGCFLQLLVAGPLAIWFDYRSPGLLVSLFHLAAGVLLWRFLAAAQGRRFAAVFLAVYWISPWRLYHSGFLWEPNYLVLAGALHLLLAWRLRADGRPPFWPSVALGSLLVLAPQLHASGMLLLLLTVFLAFKRLLRAHPGAVAAGAAAGALPLVPALLGALHSPFPAMARGSLGDIGFLRLVPLQRPLQYWLRISTPDLGRRLRQTVFYPGSSSGGATESGVETLSLGDLLLYALQALSLATMVLALVASIWYFRGLRGRFRAAGPGDAKNRPARVEAGGYLRRYSLAALAALVCGAGLSPQTLQGWHSLVVLHAACLPVTAWIIHRLDRGERTDGVRSAAWTVAIALFLLLRLPQVLLVGIGHPMYRPPTDPAARARVEPENLPTIELEPIPFGSGKESEGPLWRYIPLR